MCRASDSFFPTNSNAYPQSPRISSIYVRFPGHLPMRFPESLTLVYLPRISEAELEIDGTKVRQDLPAFVTLHHVRDGDGVSYGCRDKVRAGARLWFEVYLREEKILKGTFRKELGVGKVEYRCAMEGETAVREGDVVARGGRGRTRRRKGWDKGDGEDGHEEEPEREGERFP